MPFLLKNGPNSNKVEKGHILPLTAMSGKAFKINCVNCLMKWHDIGLTLPR